MSKERSTTGKRWLIALMLSLPVLWLLAWYFAWFDHNDWLGALRQIGGIDERLYRSTKVECDAASRARFAVEIYGAILLVIAELALFLAVRRRPQ